MADDPRVVYERTLVDLRSNGDDAPPHSHDEAPADVVAHPAAPLRGVDGLNYTDVGNAERLVAEHGPHLRYVPAWGRWIVYADGRWHLDHADTIAAALAADVGRRIAGHLPAVYKDRRRLADVVQWARRSESAHGIDATLRVARSLPGVAIDHELLDADGWLLNVTNGTIDLRTGNLGPHDPTQLITTTADVDHDPTAVATCWLNFVKRVLPDGGVRRFVRRLAGLALLGGQPEHILPIALGRGANGKSTFTIVIARVLGDYAVATSRDLLIALKHDTHPTARAALFRKRLAHSGEIPADAALDEAQVKQLTGGDRISARRMREDPWEFDPTHLLWLHANHRPRIEGTDDGIWRRVLEIPFTVQIPEAEQNHALADEIAADERAGVLRWMLAGFADYRRGGLRIPDAVRVATDRYRIASDTAAGFVADTGIIFSANLWMRAEDLLAEHGEWFRMNDTGPTSEQAHYNAAIAYLRERGAIPARSKAIGRHWRGIGLAAAAADAQMASDQGGDAG